MANYFDAFLVKFNTNVLASTEATEAVEKHFGCILPADYKSFLLA